MTAIIRSLFVLSLIWAPVVTAQVYSPNIVGYAMVKVAPGYNLLVNPLHAGVTNGANEIMPALEGELILTWSGIRFAQVGYDSGFGGWVGADGQTAAHPPSLPPGKGFFFFNPGPATNITFVGQVVPSPGNSTNIVLGPFSLVGSMIPANVTSITDSPVRLPIGDGMLILQWSGSNYIQTGFDSGFGGWVGADGQTPTNAPPYRIGEGFFWFLPGGPPNWTQTLP